MLTRLTHEQIMSRNDQQPTRIKVKSRDWQLNIASRSALNGGTLEKNIIVKAI